MTPNEGRVLWEWAGREGTGLLLGSTRLVPLSLLCPLLGGWMLPAHSRLALILSLSSFLRYGMGVASTAAGLDAWQLLALMLRELALGTALGLLAGWPFEAARAGGRWIDLLRGSSAEVLLPQTGSRETVSGELLHQLLLVLALTGLALPLFLQAVVRSYGLWPLGQFVPSTSSALEVVRFSSAAFSTGLAMGAPLAAVALGVDAAVALIARLTPALSLAELTAPLKLWGGGLFLWAGLALIAQRLQHALLEVNGVFDRFAGPLP